MGEQWRAVVGHEGYYEVSDAGRVRSLYREGEHQGRWGVLTMRFPAREMKICKTQAGYCYLALRRPGVAARKHLVHRLVMAAFVGEAAGRQVNHKDGVKANNTLSNLEYCTAQENLLHLTRVLKRKVGEGAGASKLKDADIPKIRADTRILKEIAKEYGVSLQAIWMIRKGKNWTHIS